MFQVANPRFVRASAIGAVIRMVAMPFVQQPPWMTIATGNGPLPGGRRNSPTWMGPKP